MSDLFTLHDLLPVRLKGRRFRRVSAGEIIHKYTPYVRFGKSGSVSISTLGSDEDFQITADDHFFVPLPLLPREKGEVIFHVTANRGCYYQIGICLGDDSWRVFHCDGAVDIGASDITHWEEEYDGA